MRAWLCVQLALWGDIYNLDSKSETACFQVWHLKTVHSDPFDVLWVLHPRMSFLHLYPLKPVLCEPNRFIGITQLLSSFPSSLCPCSKNRWREDCRKKWNWRRRWLGYNLKRGLREQYQGICGSCSPLSGTFGNASCPTNKWNIS